MSFNERDLLAACLRSMERDVRAGRAEVWVVDNASTDGSPGMVEREFPWVSLIASEENLGYGPAVNLVAERTAGEWIAPANQDIELSEDALERMLAAGQSGARTATVAPRLVGTDGRAQHSVHPFPTVWLTLVANLGLHRLSRRLGDRLCIEGSWDDSRPRVVPWAIAAFVLVRRDAFDQVGGFDASQWLHAEDLDLAWRLDREGWDTWYEAAADVRHVGSVATGKLFGADLEARWMNESYAWMARRRGRLVARAVALVNVAGTAVRLAGLSVLAAVRPARFRSPRNDLRRWLRVHAAGLRYSRTP